MFELSSKYGSLKIYAETIEQEAIAQILETANSPLGEGAHIRIMPDAHAGKGCTIGTTMIIRDRVCPNLVGVDIGCGVDLAYTNINFSKCLDELDAVIRKSVPFGMAVHEQSKLEREYFERLYCWDSIQNVTQDRALRCLGTLGGGNHFIEAYDNGAISVHSGSRNIGLTVANFYQTLAQSRFKESAKTDHVQNLMSLPPEERQAYKEAQKGEKVKKDLMYLSGNDAMQYLHDADIMTKFAEDNRNAILNTIICTMGGSIRSKITSTHNYIGGDNILRKGAISARDGEKLVIPLNMRDGMLVCVGQGNEDWNYSAPHGAGRLYSRTKAKEIFALEEYEASMKGIYTTCVNQSTLDEAPFVYKNHEEIENAIAATVEIIERLIPIYNFKAN